MRRIALAFCAALLAGAAGGILHATPRVVLAAPSLGPVHVPIEGKPAKQISAYNLFKDARKQIPNDGLVPYDLNTTLFTDYALKQRFVWMPPGTHANYNADGVFDFPVGAVLVKSFGYNKDDRDPAKGQRNIETRLLVHQKDGWKAWPYVWNADMSDARLAVAGAKVPVSWVQADGNTRSIHYLVPNMNQCKECHANQNVLNAIGPKARNLNRDIAYDGDVKKQLAHWTEIGYLEGAPVKAADAPRVPNAFDAKSGPLGERARAWLDVNCAHCHNPKGPAYTSGLDLSWPQTDPARYGVWKPPVAAGLGSGGLQFGIVPSEPDHSILLHRIDSTQLGVMMAPLGRTVVDKEGLALIREWIAGMPKTPPKVQ